MLHDYNSDSGRMHVNLMDQYRPFGEAHRFPDINRPITEKEFE